MLKGFGKVVVSSAITGAKAGAVGAGATGPTVEVADWPAYHQRYPRTGLAPGAGLGAGGGPEVRMPDGHPVPPLPKDLVLRLGNLLGGWLL